ncbi:MAG TPA: AbrB/MazE/SpoVT family DNA-binding domain-containing protein [Paenibacillus sp.]|uniref:AbrB/MazE/SpoVT family DNA-binding domain-containing protein n=1 Tax=Paenibacillus sp. TaxID=58172 RepID=UPI002BC9FA0D|nr:AbrB/MazE/SpoVT family DNA-binding domain-containing protein [Paenibacillus sp.]HUC92151.1 AbrB/MazE/SpoVT family DNA-binding domain-containing protein [Paenibacillus sp.]
MEKITSGLLSTKGALVIPVKVRKMLGLEEGDRVEFVIQDGKVTVEPLKQYDIFDVVGILKTDKPLVDVREVRDSIMEELITDDIRRQKTEV